MPPKRGHAATNDDPRPSSSSQPPSSKKTRFLEPDEDPVNFAAEVDASLETRERKGRVKTEGYDSDSSDDGEGVVYSRRKGAEGGGEDEDDDMFAMGDKEDKDEGASKTGGKKKEEYLRLGDIEGQEFEDDKSLEEQDEDSVSEDEPEDEDDAERRRKAGMGYEISQFNMRDEMEEGKFSADGTFVRTIDPHAVHDRWLDGVDEREMKRARRQKRHIEKAEKERARQEEKRLKAAGGKTALEKEMLGLMMKGETVLEALQRFGARAKKGNSKPPKKKASDLPVIDGMHAPMAMDSTEPETTPLSEIEQLTHLASTLMSLGDTDIYSKTYEHIVRSVRSHGDVEPDWVPPSAASGSYEYKWAVPGSTAQEGDVYGPFTEGDMQSWYDAAYFGVTGEKVKLRKDGGGWGTWDEVFG